MEKFNLTINRIWENTIETKFGPKTRYSVEFKERPKTYISSWAAGWNQGWKTGDVIECAKEQLKEREYNGKKYYTLMAPPEARFNGNGVSKEEFDMLVLRVGNLEELMKEGITEECAIEQTVENIEDGIPF